MSVPFSISLLASKIDWNFNQRDFKSYLIPANGFCPGIAVEKEKLSDHAAESEIDEYYLKIDPLVCGIITANQVHICKSLYTLKYYLNGIGLTLTNFVCREKVFRGSKIFYNDSYFTMGNMDGQKKRTVTLCETLHTYVPPLPTIPAGYPIPHPKNSEYDPYKMYGIHDFLKQINFKCLTDKESINNILYDLLYPYSDPETQTILMKRKWDDINYIDLANYINSKIRNDSKQENNHSEQQQTIPLPQQAQLSNTTERWGKKLFWEKLDGEPAWIEPQSDEKIAFHCHKTDNTVFWDLHKNQATYHGLQAGRIIQNDLELYCYLKENFPQFAPSWEKDFLLAYKKIFTTDYSNQAMKLLEPESVQTLQEQKTELQLKKYDNFDFINRIEVDGLKFTIYYGEYEKDVIYPNTFPGCFQNNKPSERWCSIINTLSDKRPIPDKAVRKRINDSFKKFLHNKGIDCPSIIGKDKKYQVKNISVKSHGDSYRKEQGRRYKLDQFNENDDFNIE